MEESPKLFPQLVSPPRPSFSITTPHNRYRANACAGKTENPGHRVNHWEIAIPNSKHKQLCSISGCERKMKRLAALVKPHMQNIEIKSGNKDRQASSSRETESTSCSLYPASKTIDRIGKKRSANDSTIKNLSTIREMNERRLGRCKQQQKAFPT